MALDKTNKIRYGNIRKNLKRKDKVGYGNNSMGYDTIRSNKIR